MPGTPSEDISNRFDRLATTAGSIGEKIVSILKSAAHEINNLAEHASPALLSIIQRLEQGAHVSVSAPALQEPHQDPSVPASTSATDAGNGATSETAQSSSPTSTDSSQETTSPSPTDSPGESSDPTSPDSATESKG